MTAASTRVRGLPADALVGRTVVAAEARGKHLLVRFDSGQVLHSHLRMSGSWHVYREGERWRRPPAQARLVLTCGDRVAVCFNAPVLELLARGAEAAHPALAGLGPDVLVEPLDLPEVIRRARAGPPETALGELLLDQRVAAGIGNIYRCEALFLGGQSPWTPVAAVTDDELGRLVETAANLMKRNLGPWTRGDDRWVYRRAGRGCRRCGTLIRSRGQGLQARTAYWCPHCQPDRPLPVAAP